MRLYSCFMIEEDSITQDQGLEWHCCSAWVYWYYRISGEKKVKIDWYKQFVPWRGNNEN